MIKEILKESFKITWRRPSLWFWGFLPTLILFSTNDLAFVFVAPSLFLNFNNLERFPSLIESPLSISLIFLVFLSSALLLLVATLAEIKIIMSVKKFKTGNLKTEKGTQKIWSVLFVRFLEVLFLMIVWLPAIILSNKATSSFSFLLIFLSTSLTLLALFFTRYTIFYLLIEKLSIALSAKNAFFFLKKHWLTTVKISFFLFIIVFIYTLVVFSLWGSGMVTYPLRLVNFLLTAVLENVGFWLSFIATALLIFFSQIIIIGFIVSYQIVSWVVFFLTSREHSVDK
ncbi:MAG: hypothetical protein KGZ86_07550 [Candidatus Latescibacteria bacterium]|nr:hypothetical protein [Candidatus Latescibacterota bacterium]